MKKDLLVPSRRSVLKGMGAGIVASAIPRKTEAQSTAPIKQGLPFHPTGVGAADGRG